MENPACLPGVAREKHGIGFWSADMTWLVAIAGVYNGDIAEQTELDRLLQEQGTGKQNLLSILIYLSDLKEKLSTISGWSGLVRTMPMGLSAHASKSSWNMAYEWRSRWKGASSIGASRLWSPFLSSKACLCANMRSYHSAVPLSM
ncbi:hypothetical protein [Mesorhizobium amorphae]|uniref:hypothetical protein n=1 Tax=Mesorhizobium amorphae TaxID=71433 RepID=UPI00177CABBA|nr:hypothetical protein [Mesorhizobium amorphae]